MSDSTEPILYTVRAAAAKMSVCPATLRLWIYRGYLPVRKLGNLVRIHRKDLERLAQIDLPTVHQNKQARRKTA